MHGEPSILNIDALEETEVFQIEKEALEKLYVQAITGQPRERAASP